MSSSNRCMALIRIWPVQPDGPPARIPRVTSRIGAVVFTMNIGRNREDVALSHGISSVKEVPDVVASPRVAVGLRRPDSELTRPVIAEAFAGAVPDAAQAARIGRRVVTTTVRDCETPSCLRRQKRHEAPTPVALDVGEPDTAHKGMPLGRAATLTPSHPRSAALPRTVVDGEAHRSASRAGHRRPYPFRRRLWTHGTNCR